MPRSAATSKAGQLVANRRPLPAEVWERWPDKKLLELRLCDLDLKIEGTWLEGCIQALYEELENRRLLVRPHTWLSNEWFCPAGIPGIAIPFYLAHPRLKKLEAKMMLEVEGGTPRQCKQLLRHEAGHAIEHAFELRRRRRWQKMFGKSSKRYPDSYRPNPTSKRFVQHLPLWYAQSHPDEDFAETFAVWLTPRSRWRERYKTWPAIRKLEYVDELMREIAGQKPKITSRKRIDPLPELRMTLRAYYDEKRERYQPDYNDIYDLELRRLFADGAQTREGISAAQFLTRNRQRIRQMVARWTGEYELTLDTVLREMIGRCRELRLRAVGDEDELVKNFLVIFTAKVVHYVHHNREWHPL